jgi:hypothetical protein
VSSEAWHPRSIDFVAGIALLAALLLPRPLPAQTGVVGLALEPGYRWSGGDANHPHAAAIGGELDVGVTQLAGLRLTSTLYHAPGGATRELPTVGAVTGGELGGAVVVLVDVLDAWVPTISVHALAGFAPALAATTGDLLTALYLGAGAGIGLDYRLWDPCQVGIGVRYTLLARPLAADLNAAAPTSNGVLDLFLRLTLRTALF